MSTDDDPDTETTRITRKGQVTIPKHLREEMAEEMEAEIREKRRTEWAPE